MKTKLSMSNRSLCTNKGKIVNQVLEGIPLLDNQVLYDAINIFFVFLTQIESAKIFLYKLSLLNVYDLYCTCSQAIK